MSDTLCVTLFHILAICSHALADISFSFGFSVLSFFWVRMLFCFFFWIWTKPTVAVICKDFCWDEYPHSLSLVWPSEVLLFFVRTNILTYYQILDSDKKFGNKKFRIWGHSDALKLGIRMLPDVQIFWNLYKFCNKTDRTSLVICDQSALLDYLLLRVWPPSHWPSGPSQCHPQLLADLGVSRSQVD